MSQPDSPLLPPAAAAVPATTTTGPIVVRADGPRRVAVLNTGGTIGMKPDAAGALAPCPGYLAERMLGMHEFARNDMPAVDLFELLPLLDSSDMGPDDWLRIAAEIAARYDAYDAFVVIMGTDTMAYAASALSFLLENLGKRCERLHAVGAALRALGRTLPPARPPPAASSLRAACCLSRSSSTTHSAT